MTQSSRHPDAQSEFGKGLVTCLIKFAEHAEVWPKLKDNYSELSALYPGHFSETDAVQMFFSGASDHLYELEVPEDWGDGTIAKKVTELKELGLSIGHGFTGLQYSGADVKRAYDLCEEIALLIDKKLGLNPDIGQF